MKKTIGLTFLCLLAGCTTYMSKKQTPQIISSQILKGSVDGAPFPWLRVLPSERAVLYSEVDFHDVSRLIRYSMSSYPERFNQVTLVLVDYTILPLKEVKGVPTYAHQGVKYCQNFIRIPMRYMLRLSFYKCGNRPPCAPNFVGTAILSPSTTPVYESISFMASAVMDELFDSSLNDICIHLNMDSLLSKKMKEKWGLSGHLLSEEKAKGLHHYGQQPSHTPHHHRHHHYHHHKAVKLPSASQAPATPSSSSMPTTPSSTPDSKAGAPASGPTPDATAPVPAPTGSTPDASEPAATDSSTDKAPVRGIVA